MPVKSSTAKVGFAKLHTLCVTASALTLALPSGKRGFSYRGGLDEDSNLQNLTSYQKEPNTPTQSTPSLVVAEPVNTSG